MKKILTLVSVFLFFLSINTFATLGVLVNKSSYVGGYGVSCKGLSDGWAEASYGGGTPPYTIVWSNAATTARINSLPAGTYSVTVTDSLGATASFSVTLTEPSKALSVFMEVTNISCHGKADGYISASPSGGTSSYSFEWNHHSGESASFIDSLGLGVDSVVVTDANGCIKSAGATISQPAAITLSLYSPVHSNGFNLSSGHNDGAIELSVSGGTLKAEAPYYSFHWSNGPFTQNISNLALGQYAVEVTDKNNCVKVDSIFLTSEDSLSPDAVPFNTRGNRLNASEDFIGTINSSAMIIRTNDIERMRIDENGNVGIGEAAPTEKFVLNGNGKISGSLLMDGLAFTPDSFDISVDSAQYYRPVIVNSQGQFMTISHDIGYHGSNCISAFGSTPIVPDWVRMPGKIYVSCTDAFVGIGTLNPQVKLHVAGSSTIEGRLGLGTLSPVEMLDVHTARNNFAGMRLNNYGSVSNSTVAVGIDFYNDADFKARISSDFTTGNLVFKNATSTGDIKFQTDNSTTDKMTILNNGNVGIGTLSPSTSLHINNGTLKLTPGSGQLWTAGDWKVAIEMDAANCIRMSTASTVTTNKWFGFGVRDEGWYWFNGSDNTTSAVDKYPMKLEFSSCGSPMLTVSNQDWCDSTFAEGNEPESLYEVEKYYKKEKHLKDIPSEAELRKKGLTLNEMQKLQMDKIENIYKYLVQLQKENDQLKKEVEELKSR